MKNLLRNKRGIGTIVGAVILVGIIMTLTLAIFTCEFSYQELMKRQQDLARERLSEEISIPNLNETSILVSNTGTTTIHIVALYKNHVLIKNPDIYIDGGSEAWISLDTTLNASDVITVASARGNLVSLEGEKIVVIAHVAKGIGSVSMDFDTFKYYEVEDNVLVNYPEGKAAFKVPSGKSIVFAVFLYNYDLKGRTITLNPHTLLWAYFPKSPGNPGIWYIVNIESDGTIATTYTPISLAYGESKWIFFGPGKTTVKSESGAVNLILLGNIDSQEYGQNLPFVSIYVTP